MENEALILIKPDGVKRNIIGEVIGRFERTGLEIIGMKLTKPTEKQLKKHYPDSKTKSMGQKAEEKFKEEGKEFKWTPEEYGEIILKKMRESFKNSKIIAMILRGPNACEASKKIAGTTEPIEAMPGTIRGDFQTESYEYSMSKERAVKNIVHVSDEEEAKKEIKIWFNEEEIHR